MFDFGIQFFSLGGFPLIVRRLSFFCSLCRGEFFLFVTYSLFVGGAFSSRPFNFQTLFFSLCCGDLFCFQAFLCRLFCVETFAFCLFGGLAGEFFLLETELFFCQQGLFFGYLGLSSRGE